MAEKTILIIFCLINVMIWVSVADWMRKVNEKNQRINEARDKYYHDTFVSMKDMTTMNLSAMNEFIKQISTIIEARNVKTNAPKNRK